MATLTLVVKHTELSRDDIELELELVIVLVDDVLLNLGFLLGGDFVFFFLGEWATFGAVA